MKLSVNQKKVLAAIAAHLETHNGSGPSLKELCALTGLKSNSNIHYHIEVFAARGLLTVQRVGDDPKGPIAARSYRLTPEGVQALGQKALSAKASKSLSLKASWRTRRARMPKPVIAEPAPASKRVVYPEQDEAHFPCFVGEFKSKRAADRATEETLKKIRGNGR